MVDFRKILLALIAGALLLTTVASAANYSCAGTSVTPLIRWEGRAELLGDVVLFCTGDFAPSTGRVTVNIRMRLNTNATPRLVGTVKNEDATLDVTESLLILDEGASGLKGYSNQATLATYNDGSQNTFQAVRINDREIEWQGVTLYGGGATNTTKQIRITNVRGNASQFSATGGSVVANISITTPSTVLLINNTDLLIGDVRQGVYMTVEDVTLRRCELPRKRDETAAQFSLEFHEGGPVSGILASSFRWQGFDDLENANRQLGISYFNESGFNVEAVLAAGQLHNETKTPLGKATQGTQLQAVITGIPAGVTLTFPTFADPVPAIYGMEVKLVGTNARTPTAGKITVVYEVTKSPFASVSNAEVVEIPVTVSYSPADSDVNLLTLPSAKAAGGFAPTSSVIVMKAGELQPRFMDTAVLPGDTVFAIGPCRTILLFPYLTNTVGFDSGIAISNTSADPLGTKPQAGTCTLNFYGLASGKALTAAQSVQTTPVVPAGGQFLMLLSSEVGSIVDPVAPTTVVKCAAGTCVNLGFQGYMFATCNFQFAHGFAFVSDLGSSKLAMGYLALIVPDRGDEGRLPQNAAIDGKGDGDGNGRRGANQGEQLGM